MISNPICFDVVSLLICRINIKCRAHFAGSVCCYGGWFVILVTLLMLAYAEFVSAVLTLVFTFVVDPGRYDFSFILFVFSENIYRKGGIGDLSIA